MKHILRLTALLCSILFFQKNLPAQTPQLVIPSGLREIVGVHDVNISPDQRILVAIAGRNIQVYDYPNGILFKNIVAKTGVSAVSFSKDSRTAFVSGDEEFLVVDLMKMEIVKKQQAPFSGLSHARSADGKAVFFGYEGLQRFDVATETVTVLKVFPEAWGTMSMLSVSPDGKQVMAHLFEYKTRVTRSVIMDAISGNVIKELPVEQGTFYASFTPLGNLLKIKGITVPTPYGDNYNFEISWVNATTLKQIGKTQTVENGEGFDNRFAFLPNSDDCWASIAKGMKIQFLSPDKPAQSVDLNGVVSKSRFGTWRANALRLTRDGSRLVIGCDDSQVIEVEVASGSQTRIFGYQVFSPNFVNSNPSFKGLAMIDNDNNLQVLYSESGRIRQKKLAKGMTNPVFSNNGKYLASGGTVWRTDNFKDPIRLEVNPDADLLRNTNGLAASFSKDDKLVCINGATETLVARLPGGERVATIYRQASISFFSSDSRTVYLYFKNPYSGSEKENYLLAWDLTTQTTKWEVKFEPEIFRAELDARNDKCVIYSANDGLVWEVNLSDGTKKKLARQMPSMGAALRLSPSGKYITDQGKVFNTESGSIFKSRPGTGYVNTGMFLADDRIVVNPLGTNETQFWDLRNGQSIGQLIMLAEDDQWAFVTPDGRFDASPEMMKKLYFSKGTEIIPLDRLSEKYYTPRLFSNLLENAEIPPPPVNNGDDDIKKLKSPPTVKLIFENNKRNLIVEDDSPVYVSDKAQVALKVEAACPDDAVVEIRLFQNGKAVQGTRNLIVEDDQPVGEKTMLKTFNVVLDPGENRFKAVAFNTQRTESQPAEITITLSAPSSPTGGITPSDTPSGGIQCWLVVVGINQYKNPKYNLNYATADAKSFKESIEQHAGTIFSKINPFFVQDAAANKTGIITTLEQAKAKAGPKDVLIFYYAGHGVMAGEGDKQTFYLVPQDVIQLYGNDEAIAQKGLSVNELRKFSQEIRAQKQLFILDACQSAGALEAVAMRGAAEEKAIAQLARATGTHWLTASGSEQFASEFTQLGHGAFTYALLEALSGKADSGDGKITVKEIDAYLQEYVPILTQKHKGTPQFPASYGFGNDFPVGVVK